MSKKKKQTFLSYLKERNPDEIIYLGTENGSSWIVIEPASVLIEKIDEVNKIVRERVEKALEAAQADITSGPALMMGIRDDIVRWENKDNIKELYDEIQKKSEAKLNKRELEVARQNKVSYLKARLFDWEKTFANAVFRRAEVKKHLMSWKDIKVREVIETYRIDKSGGQDSGIAVKVTGNEDGTLWWRGEKEVL